MISPGAIGVLVDAGRKRISHSLDTAHPGPAGPPAPGRFLIVNTWGPGLVGHWGLGGGAASCDRPAACVLAGNFVFRLALQPPGADNETTMSVLMELSRILIAETRDYQLIELKEVDGERRLPIVIGIFEAAAIERRLKGVQIKRPQTHDLLANTIEALGGRLERIVINDLREDTFFAQLVINQDGQTLKVDSRPSDAIALGIANEVPIYVEADVLERAATQ